MRIMDWSSDVCSSDLPDRRDMIGAACTRDHFACAGEGGLPDFGGVMFDEPRAGIMLPDLALRAAERGAVGAEKHRARRRRALVDDDDLFRPGVHPLPFALSLSKTGRASRRARVGPSVSIPVVAVPCKKKKTPSTSST